MALKLPGNLRVQSEVLNLDLLCAETDEIRELLSSWGNGKKRKASAIKEDCAASSAGTETCADSSKFNNFQG